MKKLAIISLLFVAALAHAQRTTVTATVLDPSGTPYQNCSYSVNWVNQSSAVGVLPSFNGGSLTQTIYPGQKCDSFATLSIQLPPNTLITPQPNIWQFQICDNTGKICFVCPQSIGTTTPQDISSSIQACAAPLPSSGGGGGGGGSPFAVVTNPGTAATNTIVPTVNNIPGLTDKCPAGSSSNQIAFQITDSSSPANNIFSVTCGGVVTVTSGLGGTIFTGDVFGALQQVPFSANETFNASGTMAFKTTLTGNVTSSSLINIPSNAFGKEIAFIVCQDGVGSHTFAWPSNVIGAPTVPTTASQCNGYIGVTDGVNLYIQTGAATGGGGSGITGTLTSGIVPLATSTGLNGTVGNSIVTQSGTPPITFTPRLEGTRYTQDFIWSQSPSGTLTGGTPATVTLTPTPYGIDSTLVGTGVESVTLGPYYYIDIAGTGTAETVPVDSTTCSSSSAGSGSCTITFTPANSHSAGFTVGTANAGTQEAINDCEGNLTNARFCHIVITCPVAAAFTKWDAPVITHGNNIDLDGEGCAKIQQTHRQQGIIMGDHNIGANTWEHNTIHGITISPAYSGTTPQINLVSSATNTAVLIGSASESGSTATYNTLASSTLTAGVCPFTTGQTVQISGTGYGGNYNNSGAGVVVLAPGCNGGTSFTATLLTTGNAPISTFGSAITGQCTWTVNFTATTDFKYRDWIYIGGNLNSNVIAGIRQVTDNPPSGSTIHFTENSCSAVQGVIYSGGFAVVDYSAIEDNNFLMGNVYDIRMIAGTGTNNYHYGYIITADQNAVFDRVHAESSNGFRQPTTEWTGAAFLGPGASGVVNGNSLGILKLKNSFISAGSVNAIDWQAANDIEVSDTILQNSPQFFARVSNHRGAFGTAQFHGDHLEGACNNAFNANLGCANILSLGMPLDWNGIFAFAQYPKQAAIGDQQVQWIYYVQPVSSTSDTLCSTQPNDQRCLAAPIGNWGSGPVLPFATANVDHVTFGSPTIYWPPVRGATSYNVFKVTAPAASTNMNVTAPFGTGNYGVATAVNPLTACTDNVCTITDSTGNSPNSVTIPTFSEGSYYPYIDFWPGSVFMGVNTDNGGPSFPNATFCTPYRGAAPFAAFTTVSTPMQQGCQFFTSPLNLALNYQGNMLAQPDSSPPGSAANGGLAFMMPAKTGIATGDGGLITNVKGKLNFGTFSALGLTYPFDLITWRDSNFAKTLATSGGRPSNDAADCASGLLNSGTLYGRCATGFNWYVNSLPTGSPVFSINSAGVVVNGTLTGVSGFPGVLTRVISNDNVTGTTAHRLVQYTGAGVGISTVKNYLHTNVQGYNGGQGFAGVALNSSDPGFVSGTAAGTSGKVTVQREGWVLWTCDNQTAVGDVVRPSTSVDGECNDPGAGALNVNENPNTNTHVGRVIVANSGSGTDSLVDLSPMGTAASTTNQQYPGYLIQPFGADFTWPGCLQQTWNDGGYFSTVAAAASCPFMQYAARFGNTEAYAIRNDQSTGSDSDDWVFTKIDGGGRISAQFQMGLYTAFGANAKTGGTSSPAFNLNTGNVMQFACTGAGATITPAFSLGLFGGKVITVVFVQNATPCTWTWPANVHGGANFSGQAASTINTQQFIVSNNGTDLYALGAGSLGMTGGTP